MGLVSQQAKAQWALTEPDPVELPFTEGIAAVFEAGRLTDQSFSTQYQTREALKASMQRLGELGGPKGEVPWPLPDSTANAALDWLDSHKDTIAALRGPDNGPPDPFLKTGEEIRQDVKQRVEEARALASRAGLGAQLVGGMGVGLTDPLNLALLPLGVGAAEGLLARVATEAGIGAVSQTAVEIASAGAKERAGVADGFGAAALRVAETAAGAGILGGIFHGAGRVAESLGFLERYRKGVAEGTIVQNRLTEEAANAIQDHLDTVPPLSSPAAEAAHFEATAAAVDVVKAETPEAQAMAARRLNEKAAAVPPVSVPAPMLAVDAIREMENGLSLSSTTSAGIAAAKPKVRETVLAEIRRRGGIDPESLKGHIPSGQLGQSGLLTVSRRGAPALDQVHATAIEEGLIPAGTSLDDFVDILQGKVKTVEAQDRIANEKFSKETGAQSGWSHVEKLKQARQILLDEFGSEPPLKLVEDYLADPAPYEEYFNSRWNGDAIETAVAREAESPRPPVVEPSVDYPTASLPSLHETERADFAATVEAKPDIAASVVDDSGNFRAGTARELMAESEQRATTFRDIMTCILKGGPTE